MSGKANENKASATPETDEAPVSVNPEKAKAKVEDDELKIVEGNKRAISPEMKTEFKRLFKRNPKIKTIYVDASGAWVLSLVLLKQKYGEDVDTKNFTKVSMPPAKEATAE